MPSKTCLGMTCYGSKILCDHLMDDMMHAIAEDRFPSVGLIPN